MTPDYLKIALDFTALVIAIGSGVYAFFATRRKDVERKFEEAASVQRDHDRRLTELEKDIERLPGTAEVNRIMIAMAELKGSMDTMSAKLDGTNAVVAKIENAVSIHQEHLMKGAGK